MQENNNENNKDITELFTPKKHNSVAEYEWLRHSRAYIQQKSAAIPDDIQHRANREQLLELMHSCGYRKNLHKFREHRREWDTLRRPVPKVYLEALGVDLDILQFALELDQQENDAVQQLEFYPKRATERLMAAVYRTVEFPAGINETEAVAILQQRQQQAQAEGKRGFRCMIVYPGLRTVAVEPDGGVHVRVIRPTMRFTKAWVIYSADAGRIGTTRIQA